ncbi:MAG: tetratricopeptide repeat protein [Acidobacteriota bacterium]|nr:tetratricopeptide repeat protein [Acidobacteriota bacterium]MDH3785148.1 tetratricopeptide repeat protein [Acidobacteriota bacterium]
MRLSRLWLLILVVAVAAPIAAQEGSENGDKRAAKEKARQERIAEYERKREERRAARQTRRESEEAAKAATERAHDPTDLSPAEAQAVESARTDEVVVKKPSRAERRAAQGAVRLPRELARAQGFVRQSVLARDPSVLAYLDLVDTGEASAQQLGAFGNFLGQNGFLDLALTYYGTALSVDDSDSLLWLNVGTLHRQAGEIDRAAAAYTRALRLNPNNAFAHYNLGATLDGLGKYEDALEEYRIALTLDPSLGDPKTNPQAANNDRLTAVKLMLYQGQTGSMGLPLVELPEGKTP